MGIQHMKTRWPTGEEVMAEAVASGTLIDVTDIACEQGIELHLFVTPAVMQAHSVAGLRAIVLVSLLCKDCINGF